MSRIDNLVSQINEKVNNGKRIVADVNMSSEDKISNMSRLTDEAIQLQNILKVECLLQNEYMESVLTFKESVLN